MISMSDQPPDDQRFTADEAAEVIRRATAISQQEEDGLTYEQLVEVADEVGIDESKVEEALRQARAEELERRAQADTPAPWRSVADRCLEILCLKPTRSAESSPG